MWCWLRKLKQCTVRSWGTRMASRSSKELENQFYFRASRRKADQPRSWFWPNQNDYGLLAYITVRYVCVVLSSEFCGHLLQCQRVVNMLLIHSFIQLWFQPLTVVPDTFIPPLRTPLPSIYLDPFLFFKSNLNHHFLFGVFGPGPLHCPAPLSTSPLQHLWHLSCNHWSLYSFLLVPLCQVLA